MSEAGGHPRGGELGREERLWPLTDELLKRRRPRHCRRARLWSIGIVVQTSRAWCAGLLSLKCGWTTCACGRRQHRGSG